MEYVLLLLPSPSKHVFPIEDVDFRVVIHSGARTMLHRDSPVAVTSICLAMATFYSQCARAGNISERVRGSLCRRKWRSGAQPHAHGRLDAWDGSDSGCAYDMCTL